MSKSQPDKSKSPSRQTRAPDENLSPLIVKQLTNSVDLKRQELNNIYDDINHLQAADENTNAKETGNNILKHVHFESIDTTQGETPTHSRNPSPPKFSQTYTIHHLNAILKTSTVKKNQENKQMTPASKVKSSSNIKITKIPQTTTGSNKNVTTEKRPSALKIPLKQATNKINSIRPVLTFQQKRQLEQEKKAKFEQDLLALRQKIIIRKFVYIWLRLFFYSKKSASKPLILPSQAE
jgi:hypothetical protein